jgi:hypothetical protein
VQDPVNSIQGLLSLVVQQETTAQDHLTTLRQLPLAQAGQGPSMPRRECAFLSGTSQRRCTLERLKQLVMPMQQYAGVTDDPTSAEVAGYMAVDGVVQVLRQSAPT